MSKPEFTIVPVGERLVVRRIQQEKMGRTLLTEGSKDLGTEAEVVEVPDRGIHWEFPAEDGLTMVRSLRRGDHIFISRFVGVPIDVDGTEENQLVIIKADDVLGIKK